MQRLPSDVTKSRLERGEAVLSCLLAAVLFTGPVSAQEPRGVPSGDFPSARGRYTIITFPTWSA